MKFTLVSSCIILAVMTFVVKAAPGGKKFNVPLENNSCYKPNARLAHRKALAKYQRGFALGEITTEATGSVLLTDYENDIEYYGIVTVGTPGINLKLDFDTGSSDMWFASTLCPSCSDSHTKYNPLESKTFESDDRTWAIAYGDGSSASGILARDNVNLGGFLIKQQTIELAKRESSAFAADVIDGLLGLGFNTITTVPGVKTPMDNLISQGLISRPIFGVYLGKAIKGGGGEYIFGGYDTSKFKGSLTTVPIDNSQGFWGITVENTSVGSLKVAGSFEAILDTGTTLIILPDYVANSVAQAYGAIDNFDGTYNIPCDTSSLKPLIFTLGSSTFQVPPDSLVFEEYYGECIAGFAGGGDLAILGDVFLKNNYVVFNQEVPEVQIAPVAN